MERGGGDEGPQSNPCRQHGKRGELRPRVPRPALGAPAAAVEQVVPDPDRVESRVFDGPRDRGDLRPPDLTLDLGQLDAYAHGPDDIGCHRGRWTTGLFSWAMASGGTIWYL